MKCLGQIPDYYLNSIWMSYFYFKEECIPFYHNFKVELYSYTVTNKIK